MKSDLTLRQKHSPYVILNWKLGLVFFFLFINLSDGQIRLKARALLNKSTHTISVKQDVFYKNNSRDTLQYFYFNDWLNAFKKKDSPLGKHFSAEYITRFHFSKLAERGETKMDFIQNKDGEILVWDRPKNHPDIVKLQLKNRLIPGDSTHFKLQYTLRIPKDDFTGYGRSPDGDYNLRYWLITPAFYQDRWEIYSNQDLEDQFNPKIEADIFLKIPASYKFFSNLTQKLIASDGVRKEIELRGKSFSNFKVLIAKNLPVDIYDVDGIQVISDIDDEDVPADHREVTINRILSFLQRRLGSYPFKKLLVTEADYKSNPLYGLNQLPDFIRPFPDGFQYDVKMMKTITHNFLRTSLLIDPRKEEWILNALEIDLLMDYVKEFYPKTKWIGKLSEIIGVHWTHLAQLDFNDQYQFFFMNMNRLNLDQALNEHKDSLIKFNAEIANPYKAGIGFKYLEDFLGEKVIKKSIKEFYNQYKLKLTSPEDFEQILKSNTSKDVNWFFKEYVNTNVRLDFKIKKVETIGDSLRVTIKNKENNSMPVSLYSLKDKTILSKHWVEHTRGLSTITIFREDADRLALNYEGIIPEINKRNNFKSIDKIFNKPFQFRLLKDVQDPHYTQFFIMPVFNYNLYDGLSLGLRVSNRAVLKKRFSYEITPEYGFNSDALVGKLSVWNTHQFRNKNLSEITYGVSGNRYSYAYDLFYYRFSPYVTFNFRHRDLRNRERHYLSFREVSVHRNKEESLDLIDKPNYNVFNIQYTYSNRGLVNSFSSTFDYELAEKFSKVSFTAKYRKLFLNNRQLQFRFFAGAFLYNNTDPASNYFSFALDRPSDYMFDYNYYGRSESSGLFSQQFIEAEGGFKSKLQPGFANRWLTTFNADVSIWRNWIYGYGDIGLLKNYGENADFKYDSGIRVSLVQDYFELFFPVYSSLGWEIGKPDYDQKIRFIVTLDLKTLIGLFEREYY